jgi:glycosyltransferase involved in cell wall biosynthesis/GT2 family glycosyltransferase
LNRREHVADPPARDESAVDIVVPVYGAAAAVRRCVDSVLTRTDGAYRLLIVLDGLQPPDVEEWARSSEAEPRLRVLRNPRRRGFVASVNRGIEESQRDVVLLNSDTEVTSGWLGRLRQAASSHPRVATVTPFSNNATICSLPRTLVENDLPFGHDVESFGRLVERCSSRSYPRLPTGVGFCLYVRRPALDAVGDFDERRFGFGYGEEADFSMRAARAGFVHLLDDATFVFHRGQGSFGLDRRRRVRAAHRVMRRLHPAYLHEIDEFIRRDPLAPLRKKVLAALHPQRRGESPPPRRVLHVVHGFPPDAWGGTEIYAWWLAHRQSAHRSVAVFSRIAREDREYGEVVERVDRGLRVRSVVNDFVQRDPLARNAIVSRRMDRAFTAFFHEVEPELVHVHHLGGHAISLLGVLGRLRVPVVYQVQDWWGPCARSNLFHRQGFLCSGPAAAKCGECLPMTRLPGAGLWNPALYALRRRLFARRLRVPVVFVGGSQFIADNYRRSGLLPRHTPFEVVPYGIEAPEGPASWRAPEREPDRPLRFGYLGAILPHKGVEVAVKAFALLDPRDAELEIWGAASHDPAYASRLRAAAPRNVRFRGAVREDDKAAVLAGFDALVVPSVGLESFGLVAREALSLGVPVLASRRGALVEMFTDETPGATFEPEDPDDLAQLVRRLVADRSILRRWRARPYAVKGMAEHSEEIETIYQRVLAGADR